MTTEKHFIMLSPIILGKKSMIGDNFDTYLGPLIEELQMLWSTVLQAHSATQFCGERNFNLKAMLIWTSHDFPAYGIDVANCLTKDYLACPLCLENIVS